MVTIFSYIEIYLLIFALNAAQKSFELIEKKLLISFIHRISSFTKATTQKKVNLNEMYCFYLKHNLNQVIIKFKRHL